MSPYGVLGKVVIMVLEGERIRLSTEEVDMQLITEKLNDPNLIYTQNGIYNANQEAVFRYKENAEKSKGLYLTIKDFKGFNAGVIVLTGIHQIFRFGEITLFVWDQGKGYATEAISILQKHAFERMNVNRLEAGTCASNTACIKTFLRNGWKEEGMQRQKYFVKGQYENVVMLSHLKDDYLKGGLLH